jgi:hypothetical protein
VHIFVRSQKELEYLLTVSKPANNDTPATHCTVRIKVSLSSRSGFVAILYNQLFTTEGFSCSVPYQFSQDCKCKGGRLTCSFNTDSKGFSLQFSICSLHLLALLLNVAPGNHCGMKRTGSILSIYLVIWTLNLTYWYGVYQECTRNEPFKNSH